MKILIADDDAVVRTLVSKLVGKWGHEAVCAADGEEAWALLRLPDAPQLIILDWVMPGEDGIGVCERVRRETADRSVYIILLSARTDRGDLVQALHAGADDYITKPFDSEELRARIHVGCRILDLQSQLREKERASGVLQMAGVVCHEMNQPLQVIMGFSQMLLMKISPTDPNARLLNSLREGVEQLGKITRRIMTMTDPRSISELSSRENRIDLGKPPPKPAPAAVST
jgi:CheY-like chemotaxis protein